MPVLSRARSAVIRAAAAVLIFCHPTDAGPQRSRPAEAEVKAAFLFNFTKFVEWPASAPPGQFEICTLADAAFDDVLARTVAGESTDGRPIVRATPLAPDVVRACHILFIGHGVGAQAIRWIAAVARSPVLIVGESKTAEDAGAHITFVIEDNRVKFDVNDDAASQAGLKISSKLLRVARHVTAKGGQ